VSFWDADLPYLMKDALVPGAALVVVRNSTRAEVASCGVRRAGFQPSVSDSTIFEAASLSKPVLTYLVLQLVDQGRLGLETPLAEKLPGYVADDSRASSITVAHALGHSSGLPNFRTAQRPLKTYFDPGERFSYSAEGYLYLQKVVEAISGSSLEDLARRLVFEPLGMRRSSFVWQSRFEGNRAHGHDAYGIEVFRNKPTNPNAAWSLQTCAADYGRFLIAVLEGARLRPSTAEMWLAPHVEVTHRGAQRIGPTPGNVNTGVAWGLGWGLELAADTFFHWGDNGPFTSFAIGSRKDRSAFLILMNGASGFSLMPEIVAHFIPGERPSLRWLNYTLHSAPVRRLFRAALARGTEVVWPEIEKAALTRDDVLWIARGLSARGREKESAWLRKQMDAKER
jgi:CubicO group peptidase (beta-lactamase class C family)